MPSLLFAFARCLPLRYCQRHLALEACLQMLGELFQLKDAVWVPGNAGSGANGTGIGRCPGDWGERVVEGRNWSMTEFPGGAKGLQLGSTSVVSAGGTQSRALCRSMHCLGTVDVALRFPASAAIVPRRKPVQPSRLQPPLLRRQLFLSSAGSAACLAAIAVQSRVVVLALSTVDDHSEQPQRHNFYVDDHVYLIADDGLRFETVRLPTLVRPSSNSLLPHRFRPLCRGHSLAVLGQPRGGIRAHSPTQFGPTLCCVLSHCDNFPDASMSATIVLPTLVMMACTALVVSRFIKPQLGQSFSQRRKCVIRLTVATTVSHLLLEGPAALGYGFFALRGASMPDQREWMCALTAANNVLSALNATIPFFLFFLCSSQFRRMFTVCIQTRTFALGRSLKVSADDVLSQCAAGNHRGPTPSRKENERIERSNRPRQLSFGGFPVVEEEGQDKVHTLLSTPRVWSGGRGSETITPLLMGAGGGDTLLNTKTPPQQRACDDGASNGAPEVPKRWYPTEQRGVVGAEGRHRARSTYWTP
uniref:G-protein coupled receptors family 1 profile domain-containing protein n=1 Tax=Globodera rostochiensis TaxID=31243 RepID=A0A914GXR0_GLORO